MSEKDGKIRLGKVDIKMGEKTVSLTVDQARELCALLKGLFGDDATKIVHVRDYWYPQPWYVSGPKWEYTGTQWTTKLTNTANTTTNAGMYKDNSTMTFYLNK